MFQLKEVVQKGPYKFILGNTFVVEKSFEIPRQVLLEVPAHPLHPGGGRWWFVGKSCPLGLGVKVLVG